MTFLSVVFMRAILGNIDIRVGVERDGDVPSFLNGENRLFISNCRE